MKSQAAQEAQQIRQALKTAGVYVGKGSVYVRRDPYGAAVIWLDIPTRDYETADRAIRTLGLQTEINW